LCKTVVKSLRTVCHVLCQIKYAKTGTNYTFEPSVTADFESVLWKFNNDKVVEYEDGKVRWFQFKDQGRFDEKTGVLTLNGLSKKQSGSYESEILVNAVSEPKVNCIKDNEGTVTSLECFLEPEVDEATFTWTGPGDKKNTGQTLQITEEMRKDNNALFFCTAKNPVSEMETEIFLKACVSDNALLHNDSPTETI
uniref:Ig-like domain-containing protein n=1 Tax=Astyanax mexicanus TaxID=7994 RepID=A0A3B1JHE3_ASTMX